MIRTHDLLDAIEARSQLRHGPTVNFFQFTTIAYGRTALKLPRATSDQSLSKHIVVASAANFALPNSRHSLCYSSVKIAIFLPQ